MSEAANEPKNLEGWQDRVTEILEEIDPETVQKAYAGNASAQAIIQAWVVELHAAVVFLAVYKSAFQVAQDTLLEMVNIIIDTLQAILLALGIMYLLKKARKKRKTDVEIDVKISESEAKEIAGDRVKARPSIPDSTDKDKDATFLYYRLQWATHFILTTLNAAAIQEDADGEELVWRAHLDDKTCSICRYMDGQVSVDGDFLPVILKKFTKYSSYVPFMGWPHAHPRCRCWAEIAD